MIELVQQTCSDCKKTGMIRCDGCTERFCSTHFGEHRYYLDALFEQVCNDRNILCEQINNLPSRLSSNHPQLSTLLHEINEWENKTLQIVKRTVGRIRQQINELINLNKKTAEVEFDKLSKELQRRKQDDDYLEQDIERLNKQLQQLQTDFNTPVSPSLHINTNSMDWSRAIQVVIEKPRRNIANQLFIGGTLLSTIHQTQLSRLYGKNNQKWQLIYKATENGFDPEICHQRCDKQGPTLTVIQSSKGYLFGGYTSVDWDANGEWMDDKTAFLFTLRNPHNIPPTKYRINSKGENAIWSSFRLGPAFGCFDICISLEKDQYDKSFVNFPSTYTDSTGRGNLTFTDSENFSTADIEIYRLICK